MNTNLFKDTQLPTMQSCDGLKLQVIKPPTRDLTFQPKLLSQSLKLTDPWNESVPESTSSSPDDEMGDYSVRSRINQT